MSETRLGKLRKKKSFHVVDQSMVVAVVEKAAKCRGQVISTFFYIMKNGKIGEPLDGRGNKLLASVCYRDDIMETLQKEVYPV